MQELFGMKSRAPEDTFYKANTIQERLNTISLTRFARPNRVRWAHEQIEQSNIPTDVKESHQKFYDGVLPTNGLPYCIISKSNGCIYLFTADHHLVAAQPVLLGKEKGDTKW